MEHGVFYRFNKDATILAVDVNNIIIAGDSPRAVRRFKDNLSSCYGIKDMGNLQWLLGVGIDRDRKKRTISFSQAAYIQNIVKCFEMEDTKLLSIPINPGHNLTKSQQPVSEHNVEEMKNIPYREAIGLLVKFVLERDVGDVQMFRVVGCSGVSEVVGCSGVSEVVRCSDGLWLQLRCCTHNRYGPLFQSIGVV